MDYGSDFDITESDMDTKPSTKLVRSRTRERYLLKTFSIREMLKWKYNYFEVNPREHRLYLSFMQKHRVHRKSFKFKQLWRKVMDELFYQEAQAACKKILRSDLRKRVGEQKPTVPIPDPTRMLVNYDREVLNSVRKIQDEFRFYIQYPKCYPDYEEEKNLFISTNLGSHIEDDFQKRFQFYWESRISTLCEKKISDEKEKIRKHWKKLLPIYYDSGDFSCPEEVQALLLPDDEDERPLSDSGINEMTSDEDE